MADKKKAGVSVVPEFVAGEQPTADKFNAISVQLERASSELEKSVGDVWGESWPYSTSSTSKLTLPYGRLLTGDGKVNNAHDSFLDIANIARLIGPAANLSPTFPEFFDGEADPIYSVANEKIQEVSTTEQHREFWIRFPPLSSEPISFSGTWAASLTTRVLSHDRVNGSGDWCLTKDRKLTMFDLIPVGQSLDITYSTVPQAWGTGPDVPGSTYNVIPDPNQTANSGAQCTASVVAGGYSIQLPLAVFGRINDNGTNTNLNGDGDIAKNAQLSLPRVLRDNFSTPGTIIPEGFVYLRDNVTGKLYSDAVYEYNDANTLIVKNVELDVTHGFSIITIGSTITEAIHDLRYKWFRHSHDGTYGEAPIHVSSLAGILESEGDTGIYVTSQIANNWMPQYLHRDGYRADSNANDDNAMRGDLVLGAIGGNPGSHVSNSGESYGVYFGSKTGPKINKSSSDTLLVDNPLDDVTVSSAKTVSIDAGERLYCQSEEEWDIGTLSSTASYCYLRTHYAKLWQSGAGAEFLWDDATGNPLGTNSGGSTTATFRIGDNGLGNGDGEFQFGGRAFSFNSDSQPSCWNVLARPAGSARVFDVVANGGTNGLSSTTAPFIFRNYAGGGGVEIDVLELFHMGVPGDSSYYIKFTGDSSSVYGSIRGTDDASDPVFYSQHSGIQHNAATALPSTVTARDAGHIKFVSGGADYGEWLRCGDLSEWADYKNSKSEKKLGLPEGLIVYVKEGKFYRKPVGTPMVVTNRAIVVGNLKEGLWPQEECEVLSFIGQVPVMCFGSVKDGDYLVPSVKEPGTTIAIAANECSFEDYKRVVGTAWETNKSDSLKLVNCAIGKK